MHNLSSIDLQQLFNVNSSLTLQYANAQFNMFNNPANL